MDLYTIRQITAYNIHAKPSCKDALRTWLAGLKDEYQFAVTLTIKQSFLIKTDSGNHMQKLKREDCNAIAKRFIQKLNREVFGKAAERYDKGLKYFITVEGGWNGKNLHLHMAVGGFPKTRKIMQFKNMVCNAVRNVYELDEQHAVNVMDSGWMEYITKELNAKSTDNVLWDLT
jgi:hypothetical protein